LIIAIGQIPSAYSTADRVFAAFAAERSEP